MTPHQILFVGIRLLAIFWLLGLLGQIAAAIATVEQMGAAATPIWVSAALQFLVCIFLWFFPSTLASKLLRSGSEPVSLTNVPFAEWRDLCFTAVGVFVLARTVPDAVYWITLASAAEPFAPDFTVEQKANVFATLLEFVIGLALLLGARGFGNLIQRLRSAGVPANHGHSSE